MMTWRAPRIERTHRRVSHTGLRCYAPMRRRARIASKSEGTEAAAARARRASLPRANQVRRKREEGADV